MGLDEAHRLIGFIHIGTPLANLPPMDRPNPDEFVSDWPHQQRRNAPQSLIGLALFIGNVIVTDQIPVAPFLQAQLRSV
jgi:hypothetical protein